MNKTSQLAFCFILLILSACSRNSPEQVANDYWQALFISDEASISTLVFDQEASSLHKILDPGDESKVVFGDIKIEGDIAKVDTLLTWKDSEKESTFGTKTILRKTDDGWKIDTEQTQKVFFDSVYASTLSGLEAALADSANAFLELGDSITNSMAEELSNASQALQQQSEEANQEIQAFLQKLDENLKKELEKHQ
ncbi:hypothetical protein NBRC116493_03370 [Aurantivibrio infirmus]